MGDLSLSSVDAGDMLEIGEYKILLDEPDLPEFDEFVSRIRRAHEADRGIAVHTVTRTEIHFALAAIEAAGARSGDRLEHASVAPRESLDLASRLGLSVVTQPNFVAERGDDYRIQVENRDLPYLYRVRSWLEAGVPLAAGTDAPFGDPDPWHAIRAAVTRSTRSGNTLGQAEVVSPETAVALFFDPFSTARAAQIPSARLAIGQRADLCLLDVPWREARRDLSSDHVAATLCAGKIISSIGS
jgi:predicted amidohydrolase YtcJ